MDRSLPDPELTKVALFLAGSSALLNIYSTQPILGEITARFGGEPVLGTWTITATTGAVALTAPLAGSISDHLGQKRLIVPALAGTVLATLLCACAWSWASLLVFRFLQGIFIPFVFAVTIAYIANECTSAAAPRLNAIYVSGSVFGGFLGRFLSGWAADRCGWRCAFLALAGYSLLASLLVARWLPAEQRFRPVPFALNLPRHFRNGRLLATCLVGGCILFVQVAAFTFGALELAGAPHRLDSKALGSVSAVFLVGVVVTPLAGRAIAAHGRIATFAAAWGLASLGLLLCLVPVTAALVGGLALCSTGIFSAQACASGCAAEAGEGARSGAVGLYLGCYYLSGSLGAVLPAPCYQRWGWTGCLVLLLGVLLLGLGSAVAGWRR